MNQRSSPAGPKLNTKKSDFKFLLFGILLEIENTEQGGWQESEDAQYSNPPPKTKADTHARSVCLRCFGEIPFIFLFSRLNQRLDGCCTD